MVPALVEAEGAAHVAVREEAGGLEALALVDLAERQRLFDLPRSSWADYDAALISKGGGIFERSAKSITLTDEIKALTGIAKDAVTPDELIHALLKTEADLLWFGGIGTYAKASSETHAAAGDRANDAIRVDGRELKAKVVGEGANLGMTQAARIEFAQNGGRVNTDAIDNSAGVDSSDHEVNIKILAAEAIRAGDLKADARNKLLADMTDDVARHVLWHNYDQTFALTLAEATAQADHDALERLMVYLEGRGVLNRELEGLPDAGDMKVRAEQGQALTRPEMAVLLAWSKITLFDDIVASDLPVILSLEMHCSCRQQSMLVATLRKHLGCAPPRRAGCHHATAATRAASTPAHARRRAGSPIAPAMPTCEVCSF